MTRSFALVSILLSGVMGGCAQPSAHIVNEPPPVSDTLYSPTTVEPGRLEYAVDRSTFAPLLTERFTYPTQPQANFAFRRLLASIPGPPQRAASLTLFGCKPGALDEQTSRVSRYRGPVVHCATDFLDADGHRLGRKPVNFYYHRNVWNMQMVAPQRIAVPWRNRESSPKDLWWWIPGRDRYE
ncbi:hypothetical protein [Rhodopseudomonas parapalustris]